LEFSSVTISFFIHSTEDKDRLLRDVRERLGVEDADLLEEKITGHFGNEITSVRAHIIGERAQEVVQGIVDSLSRLSKDLMRVEIEKSLDEHDSLYLRLDRQTLEEKAIALSDEEPIRVKLKPKRRNGGREAMKAQYLEMLV
jgi:RNA binding exosome subunit